MDVLLVDVKYTDFFAPPPKGTAKRPNASRPSKKNEDDFFDQQDDEQDDDDEDMDKENDDAAEVNALGDRVSNLFAMDEEEAEAGNHGGRLTLIHESGDRCFPHSHPLPFSLFLLLAICNRKPVKVRKATTENQSAD